MDLLRTAQLPSGRKKLLFLSRDISCRLYNRYFLVFTALFISFSGVYGQSPSSESPLQAFDLNTDINLQLPPLDSLILLAIGQHPTIRLNQELEGAAQRRIDLAAKTWTNMVGAFFNYGYGNQNLVAAGSSNSDLVSIANGYRVGLNVSVPLSEFATRRDRISLQKHELEATRLKTSEMALVISEQIIDEYYNLLAAQRLMRIRGGMQEASRNNLMLAEQDYRSGNTEVTNYARMMEIYTIAQAEYEIARKNFFVAYNKLELVIGVPLHTLYRTAR